MTKADALAVAVQALESALSSSGQMCGDDAAGKAFGLSYRQGGQALFSAAEAAVNACRNVGYGIEVSASNYAHSEAASTVGGGEPSVPPPSKPSKFSGPTMPNPLGPAVGEPMLWAVVRQFVGSPWPDGNPATVRAAAAAWRSFGSAIAGVTGAIGSCSSELAGHDVPELANISNAVKQLSSGVQGLGTQSASIASSLDSFAGEVESSQQAIRDILHRLSASGILQELGSILSGHNPMDDIKQVANDIKEILHTLSREADGSSTLFQAAMNELDTLTTDLENWDRKEFTHFLGNPVGNLVADYVNADLDFTEGAGKSLLETMGSLGDLATHPQQLLDLLKEANPETQLMNLVVDPKGVFDRDLNMAKGLVDAKDWSGDHPLRGFGDNVGTVAQFFIPGAGEAKAGAEGARVADEAAQATSAESKAARAGDALLGGGLESDVAAQGSRITRDLDGINVKPAEPTAPAAPIKPPEAGPPVRPAEPGPSAKPSDPGAAGGAGASRAPVETPPAPHTGDGVPAGTGGGVHEPSPTAVAGGGAHEPVPVGSGAASAEHLPAPGSHVPESTPARVPVTRDGFPAEPTLASAHSPQAAPMSPSHELHPGGADATGLPHDDPGGPAGGGGDGGDSGGGPGGSSNGHGGSWGDGHGSGAGDGGDANEHGGGGDHGLGGDHTPGGISDEKRDEILALEKGSRPDPTGYLSPQYIEHHLEQFDHGATRFMLNDTFEDFGIGQIDGTTFVFPTGEIDALMEATGGDPAALEKALGLPEGYFKDNVIRVDIPDPGQYNLRMPSGNEAGANEYWLPGGLLPQGMPEAVIDGAAVLPRDLTIADLPDPEGKK